MVVRANCGVLWFAVEIRGKPVHVREAGSGCSAILSAWPVIGALQELERRWNAGKGEHRYFEDMAHPLTSTSAGSPGATGPPWCRLDVGAAIYPGWEPKDAAAEIEAAIRQAGGGPARSPRAAVP